MLGIWIGLDVGQHSRHHHGLGQKVDGLDWIRFRKLDPRPTQCTFSLGLVNIPGCDWRENTKHLTNNIS